jgi:fumarate hydratase class II
MSTDGQYRIERDALGEVRVPADAYFGAQTVRAMENFPISGLRLPRAFIAATALIKRAAAEVNAALGLLDARIAQAIAQAAQEVIDGKWDAQFPIDAFQMGAGTSQNMNANEVIANRAIELLGGTRGDSKLVHPNDHVNMAQSTNDVTPTAIRLAVLMTLGDLLSALEHLVEALGQKAYEFDGVVKAGRTHLQDAVPVRLGQEFGAYAQAVANDIDRIKVARERLLHIGIGGTAVGTGLNADPQYHPRMIRRLSELSGLPLRSSGNLFESMQNMADALGCSAALRTLAATLTRIANDLRLMASGPNTGLDEIRLPPVQPGSSIMPGKVNPSMAEMLNMVCFHVMGNDLTVLMATQAGQLELNVMMPVIALNLLQSIQILTNGVRAFTDRCVKGIVANEEQCRRWVEHSAALATALNPYLGYSTVAEVVKEFVKTGRPIRQIVLDRRLLSEAQLDEILSVRAMTEPGIPGKAQASTTEHKAR